MEVIMIKLPGGGFSSASEIEAEKLKKLQNGGVFVVKIKVTKNPKFHRKVFAFFNFCFEYWEAGNDLGFLSRNAQFEEFRKNLTCLAGDMYRFKVKDIYGGWHTVPVSLAEMDQQALEDFYFALTNAAQRVLFKDCSEEKYTELMSYF